MPTLNLRPNADAAGSSAWTHAGGPSTVHDCLSDGSMASPVDTTYSRQATSFTPMRQNLDDSGLTAGAVRIRQVRVRARVRKDNSSKINAYQWLAGVQSGTPDVMDPAGAGVEQSFNGSWRTRIPGGSRPWEVADVDALQVAFVPVGVGGVATPDVRLTTVTVDVLYADIPVLTVTAPTGTQNIARPPLTITYAQSEGIPLDRSEWRLARASDVGAPGFSPDSFAGWVDSFDVAGASLDQTPTVDLGSGVYVLWVRGACQVDGAPLWSVWVPWYVTIAFDAPTAPLLSAHPEPRFGRCRLDLVDTGNLLSTQDCDFEDAADGVGSWTGIFGNASVARTTSTPQRGSACLEITATAAGDATVFTTHAIRAKAGDAMGLALQARAVATGRNLELGFQWQDESGAAISTVTAGTAPDVTGAYSLVFTLLTAPAGTAWALPIVKIKACAASEKHRLDAIKAGTGLTVFSRGGLRPRNRMDAATSTVETSGGWVARANCTAILSTTDAAEGTHSLELTAAADGNVAAHTVQSWTVVPGRSYTALASFKRNATARSCAVALIWLDGTGTELGDSVGPTFTDGASYVQAPACTAIAPAGAATARVGLYVYGCLAGEKHRTDKHSFGTDPGILWEAGTIGAGSRFLVEYTDTPDDPNSWRALYGAAGDLELDPFGRASIYDPTCPPASVRAYRAQVLSYEGFAILPGDRSPVVYAQCPTAVFWLKDPIGGLPPVPGAWVVGPLSETIPERAGSFLPLPTGDEVDGVRAVIVTGGLSGVQATYELQARDAAAWALYEPYLRLTRPFLLVSPYGWQRWVQPLGDRTVVTPGVPAEPRRALSFPLVEVDPPAAT